MYTTVLRKTPGSPRSPLCRGIEANKEESNHSVFPATKTSLRNCLLKYINAIPEGKHECSRGVIEVSKGGQFLSLFDDMDHFSGLLQGHNREVDGELVNWPGIGHEGWRIYLISGQVLQEEGAKVLKLAQMAEALKLPLLHWYQQVYLVWGGIPKSAVMGSWGWKGIEIRRLILT